MKKLMPKLKGFTIIEVIIVLVIGAVIMLAVFVVVPQLQRQNRESQMRQIAQRVLVAARELQEQGQANCKPADYDGGTDNRNLTSCITSITGALKNPFSGASYLIQTNNRAAGWRDWIYVISNAKCVNNSLTSGNGAIGVLYTVEPYLLNTSNPDRSTGIVRCVSD